MSLSKLNTFALTLMITGAIDSIRNLPATALGGNTLLFFFLFGAVFFLIPTALVSAELAAQSEEGGIYHWVQAAFGKHMGFLAVWLQWVNNLIWFPTILSFVAGTAAYLINPTLVENKLYLVTIILFLFWSLTYLNLKGVRLSAKFTSFCTLTGLIIPMALIIGLFIMWLILGKPLQLDLGGTSFFPNLQQRDNWVSLTAVMLGFAGMELATVHIKDVNNPKKTFPRALAMSTIIILVTMVLGSLAIALVLPYDKINIVNGTMQTFAFFLSAYHLDWFTPILVTLLVIGSLGGTVSWVISPIKGLSQAAKNGFFPKRFQKENEHGVAQNLLLMQAVIVSFICLAFLFLPRVSQAYWLLTALSTQLYLFMYVLMFFSALKLRHINKSVTDGFKIPGKKLGLWLVCGIGLLGCTIALIVGFIPPTSANIGTSFNYQLIFCIGLLVMILPISFFFLYRARTARKLTLVQTDLVDIPKAG